MSKKEVKLKEASLYPYIQKNSNNKLSIIYVCLVPEYELLI